MHDLKSPEGVLAYLKGTRFAASDVQLLSGGVSAFTYRVVLEVPLDTGESTIVIKHFEGFLAHHQEMKWGIERADHEYKALAAIGTSGLFDSNNVVQLPRVLDYDGETHTIFMADLDSPIPLTQVLERGFPKNPTSGLTEPNESSNSELYKLAAEIGQALGDFLGRFHNWSALPQQAELRAYFAQNPGVVHKSLFFRHFCLTFSADRFKMREAWMDDVLTKEQQELEASTDPGALIMGDCSLHNILVSPPSENSSMRIYLIDFETARAGHPEFDIGALTATAMSFTLLYYPNIDHPFIPALHQSYRHHRQVDPRRLGITTGIDLMGLAAAGFELLSSSVMGDEHAIKTNRVVQHPFLPES